MLQLTRAASAIVLDVFVITGASVPGFMVVGVAGEDQINCGQLDNFW